MKDLKEYTDWQAPAIAPEWEIFRAVGDMSWNDLNAPVATGIKDMYRSVESGLNLQKSLSSPKLSRLSEKYGKELVCRLIGLTLQMYFERLSNNPERGFGPWRLRQTAEWVFDTYSSESLRDIMYAFRRSQARYVADLSLIMTDYLEWRAEKLEEVHRLKSQAQVTPWPVEFKEKLPQRWFLGYLTTSNGSENREAA